MSNRTVTRVLVMVEYEPGNPDNGEVFDLTALAAEMSYKAPYGSVDLGLNVTAERATWDRNNPPPKLGLSWDGHVTGGGNSVYRVSHLEDVINSTMPDGERVIALKSKVKRLRKKADEVERDAMVAKLEQVAAIRNQHPIARVTVQPGLLDVPPGEQSRDGSATLSQ